jgi:hypothetical protein
MDRFEKQAPPVILAVIALGALALVFVGFDRVSTYWSLTTSYRAEYFFGAMQVFLLLGIATFCILQVQRRQPGVALRLGTAMMVALIGMTVALEILWCDAPISRDYGRKSSVIVSVLIACGWVAWTKGPDFYRWAIQPSQKSRREVATTR